MIRATAAVLVSLSLVSCTRTPAIPVPAVVLDSMAEADVQWIDLVRSKIFAVWDLDDAELLRLGRATCAMQASDPIEFANIYANGGVEEHTADLLVEIAKQGNRPPLK